MDLFLCFITILATNFLPLWQRKSQPAREEDERVLQSTIYWFIICLGASIPLLFEFILDVVVTCAYPARETSKSERKLDQLLLPMALILLIFLVLFNDGIHINNSVFDSILSRSCSLCNLCQIMVVEPVSKKLMKFFSVFVPFVTSQVLFTLGREACDENDGSCQSKDIACVLFALCQGAMGFIGILDFEVSTSRFMVRGCHRS